MKLKRIDLIILPLLVMLLCLGAGIGYLWRDYTIDRYYASYNATLTKGQVVELLESYRQTHQYYINNPDKIEKMTGTIEDNIRLVENYTKIINFVEGE
jgi:hypothetical protein